LADTALWAAHHFNRVISIEADREPLRRGEEAIGVLRERQCAASRSQDVLAALVPKVEPAGPDMAHAHWSAGDVAVAGENQECPLLEEIAAVDAGTIQHLILIDDARFFLNPPPLPHKRDTGPSAAP